MIHTFVPGTPIPQGSVDVYRGRVVSVKAPLRKWRDSIRAATLARHTGPPLDGPITVHMIFQMPRPKRPRWPLPAVKPDGDKLCRAVFDALSTTKTQRGVITDDARIVTFSVTKTYHGNPGVLITITKTENPKETP